jgi:uncharacterized protein
LPLLDRYRNPADLPQRLAVFPLRGAILLPRAALPLNVFEPRYLAMLDDVIGSTRVIGIVQPGTDNNGEESPVGNSSDLKRVGCAGRVTSYQELDDGRLMITLTGLCRFDVVAEEPGASPYRTMRVVYDRFADDLIPGTGEDQVDRQGLLRVLKLYLDEKRLNTDWNAIQRASSEFLVNTLSIISPYGAEEKQALLEAGNLKARAEVLVALAEMELATHGGSGGTLQ